MMKAKQKIIFISFLLVSGLLLSCFQGGLGSSEVIGNATCKITFDDIGYRVDDPTIKSNLNNSEQGVNNKRFAQEQHPAMMSGLYVVPLGLQNKTFNLVFDTGSSNLIVQSDNCKGCSEKIRYKIAAKDKSNASFSLAYGSGTAIAQNISDTITPCPPYKKKMKINFGAITQSKSIPSILGAAYPPLAVGEGQKAFLHTLSEHFGKENFLQMFSHVFCDDLKKSKIILGGFDPHFRVQNLLATKIIKKQYYNVKVASIVVDGFKNSNNKWQKCDDCKAVPLRYIHSGTTIDDTGAALSVIPFDTLADIKEILINVFTANKDKFKGKSKKDFIQYLKADTSSSNFYWLFSKEQLGLFPNISYLLPSITESNQFVKIVMKPESYFKKLDGEKRFFAISGGSNFFIVGQPALTDVYAEYYWGDENPKIAFADATDYCHGKNIK